MKILVTGSTGFVGGRFLDLYGAQGLEVAGVARRPDARKNTFQADLTRPLDLPVEPDVVVHSAARASPWGTAAEFESQNVTATANVLDFCRRRGLPRVIYISSSSVFYRDEDQLNLNEDSPIGPRFVNQYARTKAAGEALVRGYPGEWIILRPRAVFGPGDTVLFPRILEAARQGRLPLITRRNGPVVGDLIYIDSLCEYILRACLAPAGRSYNLTNAQPVELMPLLADVLRRLGLPVPTRRIGVGTAMAAATLLEGLHRLSGRAGEPAVTRYGVGVMAYSKTFDVSRALVDLGPPLVSLQEGLDRFVAWQSAR